MSNELSTQGVTQTIITIEIVLDTEVYKKLSKIQKKLTSKRNNIQKIINGLNIARNIGYDSWAKSTNYYYVNKLIIRELLDNEQ